MYCTAGAAEELKMKLSITTNLFLGPWEIPGKRNSMSVRQAHAAKSLILAADPCYMP